MFVECRLIKFISVPLCCFIVGLFKSKKFGISQLSWFSIEFILEREVYSIIRYFWNFCNIFHFTFSNSTSLPLCWAFPHLPFGVSWGFCSLLLQHLQQSLLRILSHRHLAAVRCGWFQFSAVICYGTLFAARLCKSNWSLILRENFAPIMATDRRHISWQLFGVWGLSISQCCSLQYDVRPRPRPPKWHRWQRPRLRFLLVLIA